MKSINPATGRVIKEYQEASESDVERCLDRAYDAFLKWRRTRFDERAKLLKDAGLVLRQRKERYSRLMTEEMGKTITASEAEVEKCAWVCEHYAERGAEYLAVQEVPTDASKSYVRFDPLGVVLAVMPWNFPFWQVFRFAAPALMAGNVGVLKHASNVPGCALAIEEVFRDAGFPEGVFQTLLVSSRVVPRLIRDKRVCAVTLTGSEPAGREVAKVAGEVLKKCVLELGGSDPFIVLRDANIEEAVNVGVQARCINNGQSCIAAKRFIIEEPIYPAFVEGFVARMRSLKVDDPMLRTTDIGPLAREDLLEELDLQVRKSVEKGARLLLGGKRLEREGYFYAPTVLGDVVPGMPAFDEETFGPVAAMIKAKDKEDAIKLANLSDFGLGAAVFTSDPDAHKEIAGLIEAGSVFFNGMVKSDPRLPFGGVKRSGFGRELGIFGIREFVNVKTVWVK